MKFKKCKLPGVYIIDNFDNKDNRGSFTKIFSNEEFIKHGIFEKFEESFYSISNKNVIRGMHFQTPPYSHTKLVHCCNGHILDVVLDLRKNSPTYKQYIKFNLKGSIKQAIYVPIGCAHGFMSLEDNSCVLYFTSVCYNKNHDSGIRYDSFGFDWKVKNPIVSKKDLENLQCLEELDNPF